MDVKQEPFDILEEGFTIKTEPATVFGQTEQSKYCYPEDRVSENVQMFPKTVKQELVNIGDVKETYISDIKQEVDEYMQQKTESELSELLTSYCDLPTLKTESTSNLGHQCSNKSLENTSKGILKKKRRYVCPICPNNCPASNSRYNHLDGHFQESVILNKFDGKLKNNSLTSTLIKTH